MGASDCPHNFEGQRPLILPVSVVVVTKNEESNIHRCLESAAWASDRVVVDALSIDRTTVVATELGARVFRRPWPGYGAQKNFGVSQATENWILSIDADEVVTQNLVREIEKELLSPRHLAYRVYIPTFFMGKPLGHYGRARRDPGHIRLFRKDHAHFSERPVHEVVEVEGSVGVLHAPVLHYSYPTIGTYWRKIHRYALLEAQARLESGGPKGNRLLRALGKFAWMMVWRKGLLSGPHAWIWITGQAYQEWLTIAETARLRRVRGSAHAPA
jgi:glycosyltransferase involved in cell wall biosynthesis